MRAVVQRVSQAQVAVGGILKGQIGPGLLVYLGVQDGDTQADAQAMAEKLVHLRIFGDEQGKMNRSLQDTGGGLLLVSQFTLCGDCRKGRRPGFDQAADPVLAESLYRHVEAMILARGVPVETGIFRATMQVSSINDGPVTFLLDSRKLF
jgi:D-tyrosyl-tRNA(Tyr) deacylase